MAGGTATVSRLSASLGSAERHPAQSVSRCAHEALLAGIPVLALRYHCDPHSELNRLRGAQAGSAYAGHLQTTLARLEACGVFLGTINELLAKLDAPTAPAAVNSEPRRYLTVTDVVNNPALAAAPRAQLTDAAIDYLKTERYDLTQL